jgi:hypothetical protein
MKGKPTAALPLVVLLVMGAALAGVPGARAREPVGSAPVDEAAKPRAGVSPAAAAPGPRLRDLKRLELELLHSGAAGELLEASRRAARAPSLHQTRAAAGVQSLPRGERRRIASHPASGTRARQPRDREEAGRASRRGAGAPGLWPAVEPSLPANHRVNDVSMDQTGGSTQSEVTIARHGVNLVAAWNDGEIGQVGLQGIGYGWSTDDGVTWTDPGVPPLDGGVLAWTSDPALTVDEKSGAFYLAAMAIVTGPSNGLAVVRGGFSSSGFAWETPRVARSVRDTLPDKPCLAADSSSGHLYLTYTSFFQGADELSSQIEFQRSTDSNLSWSLPLRLSSDDEAGLVQGSRPAVGPHAELYVVWHTVDTTEASGGRDRVTFRRSLDRGSGFEPRMSAATPFINFASGGPGFNRGWGLGFPGIAVDRSTGPWRGRVHVVWNEALDFYDDTLGAGAELLEIEPNNNASNAVPLVLGNLVRGGIAAPGDVDQYRLEGEAGQTAVFFLDSLALDLDVALRLMCSDRSTELAYSSPLGATSRALVFTFPEEGAYYLLVIPLAGTAGGYRLATGEAIRGDEPGRDHRDVFTAHSDDGLHWSTPVRINDGPPFFDDWLPEIAVSAQGRAFAVWYDWRDAPPGSCGGASHLYLARSEDGGDSWVALGPITTAQTAWSNVTSNLTPNHGDYIALHSDANGLVAAWADGRFGTPDAMAAVWPLAVTPTQIALAEVSATPRRVTLTWRGPDPNALATVYRCEAQGEWMDRGELAADGSGALRYQDDDVDPGRRYAYRLGVHAGSGEWFTPETWVEVPRAALSIEPVQANPSSGDLSVRVSVPQGPPAVIELLDPRGRRILARTIEAGRAGYVVRLAPSHLAPGLYLLRLRQQGREVTAKATLVR